MLRKLLLMSGGVLCGAAFLAAQPPEPVFPRRWPYPYNAQARSAAVTPFINQARNAAALDHTMWLDFFKIMDDKDIDRQGTLPQAAIINLDRLARRHLDAPGGPLVVRVQRARILELYPFPPDTQRKADTVNARNMRLVRGYLAATWPQLAASVVMVDTDKPEMTSAESVTAFDNIRFISRGYIPDDLINGGIEDALKGKGTRGANPAPISPIGKAGAGAFSGGD